VEPGGAVGLASVLTGKVDVRGKSVVLVLSGGNIADDILKQGIAAYRAS
jgi:threonine dehydratase